MPDLKEELSRQQKYWETHSECGDWTNCNLVELEKYINENYIPKSEDNLNSHGVSLKFIEQMNLELNNNDPQKGDWRDWNPDKFTAVTELHYHVSKLLKALLAEDKELIAEHSADCANILMMISDKFSE